MEGSTWTGLRWDHAYSQLGDIFVIHVCRWPKGLQKKMAWAHIEVEITSQATKEIGECNLSAGNYQFFRRQIGSGDLLFKLYIYIYI